MDGFYHGLESSLLALGIGAFAAMAAPRQHADGLSVTLPMLTVTLSGAEPTAQ